MLDATDGSDCIASMSTKVFSALAISALALFLTACVRTIDGRREAAIPLVVNRPSRHRVNLGASLLRGRFLADVSASIVGEAFWVDVQPFTGTTDGYGLLNAAFGVRFPAYGAMLMIKGINLTDRAIQQHIFGDILRRRVSAELQVRF